MSIIVVSNDGQSINCLNNTSYTKWNPIYTGLSPVGGYPASGAATNGSRILIVALTKVWYSDDGGLTWTSYSDSFSRSEVFWNGSEFVSLVQVLSNMILLSSTTGEEGTWIQNTASLYTGSGNYLVNGPQTLLIWSTSGSGFRSATSVNNGVSWSLGSIITTYGGLEFTNFQSRGLTNNGSTYYAIGNNFTSWTSYFLGSSNGTTWSNISAAPFGVAGTSTTWMPRTIANNGSIMVVIGNNPAVANNNISYVSTNNGGVWTQRALPATSLFRIQSINGIFILSDLQSNNSWSSSNGYTWTLLVNYSDGNGRNTLTNSSVNVENVKATSASASTFSKLCNRVVMCSSLVSASTIGITNVIRAVTFDGISNSIATAVKQISPLLPIASVTSTLSFTKDVFATRIANVNSIASKSFNRHWVNIWSMIYAGSKWIGVKAGSALGVTSTDGATWTSQALPLSRNWSAIANNGTINAALAKNSSDAASSTDGVTWSIRTLPQSGYWNSLVVGGTTFVGVAIESDKCVTSADGINWTLRDMPSFRNWTSVAHNGTVFCAVSDDGYAAVSNDGITWTEHAMSDAIHFNCVTWALGQFTAVASGPTDKAAISTDGISWTRVMMPYSDDWTNVGPGLGNPNV